MLVVQPMQLVVQPMQLVVQPMQLVVQPMQLVVQPMQLVVQPMQLVVQPMQLVVQPMQLVVQPMQLVVQPMQLVVQPMQLGGSTNATDQASDNTQVSIVPGASTLTDTAYSPNSIEVTVGQTVVWTNDDSAFHTVTSGTAGAADVGKEFDSGLTGPTALTSKGKTFEHTFDRIGDYPYFCTLHPAMVGTVIVK